MKLATLFVPFIAAQSGEGSGSSPCDAMSCHENATCHELHTGEAKCRCDYKYYGNGEWCKFVEKNTPGRILQRTYIKLDDMIDRHIVNVPVPGWRRRIQKEFNFVSIVVPGLIRKYEERDCPAQEDDEARLAAFVEELEELDVQQTRFDNPCIGQWRLFNKISTWAQMYNSDCDGSSNRDLNRVLRNLSKSRKRIRDRFSCPLE
ncbi:Oidioi.mRNA.OKI2018_I69.PAR.g8832.t1.cds [Oikopleura dioica]|uniref:Oidioi.mRNA.OKI2018_I69.PAR.g8832.t1.cds n=1 Tax=Oikopleura dioica TaxID=34765 RepID=A0ABN7RIX2_OIKDI|nr:Oidioi.mRNA.OKI2018_I69.PAR.g8832.t1.cds [Oikopleura dioica]